MAAGFSGVVHRRRAICRKGGQRVRGGRYRKCSDLGLHTAAVASAFLSIVCLAPIRAEALTDAFVDTVSVPPPFTESDDSLSSWAVLPAAFHTPETGFGGGIVGGYFFKSKADSRPNSIGWNLFYTQKSQIIAGLGTELYSPEACRRLLGAISFVKFPGSFWGIGDSTQNEDEESYTSRAFAFAITGQRDFHSCLMVGPSYRFWTGRVTDLEEGGQLDSGTIAGSEGGTSSGLGFAATWDTRDNIYFTKRGTYLNLDATYYGGLLGSTWDYSLFAADFRQFTHLYGGHALGLRALVRSSAGTVPFQDLPMLGGPNLMRGYQEGRYRDNALAALQAEYRSPYWWVLAFTIFGSVGDVAGRVSRISTDSLKYTLGLGIRFRLNDESFNLRVDMAVAEGSSGVYFMGGESF